MQSNVKSLTRVLFPAVALALCGGPALAAEKVVVQSFASKGVDAAVASILESSLCTALMEEGYEVMCPEDVRAVVAHKQAQAGLGNCGANDTECLKNLGKLTDAKKIVAGEVSRLGDTFIINATLLDTESNKVLARASEKAGKAEDLLDKVKPLAKKLRK